VPNGTLGYIILRKISPCTGWTQEPLWMVRQGLGPLKLKGFLSFNISQSRGICRFTSYFAVFSIPKDPASVIIRINIDEITKQCCLVRALSDYDNRSELPHYFTVFLAYNHFFVCSAFCQWHFNASSPEDRSTCCYRTG